MKKTPIARYFEFRDAGYGPYDARHKANLPTRDARAFEIQYRAARLPKSKPVLKEPDPSVYFRPALIDGETPFDQHHVDALLAAGGFPRAVAVRRGVVAWLTVDGLPWRERVHG